MKRENYCKGKVGEERAKYFLINQGYVFIEANFKNKLGEIDLIMADREWLVFVEVKYKSNDNLGIPEEMIGRRKICQVKRIAESYLMEKKKERLIYQKYRIDAVCILGNLIKHYQNIDE